jgi:hypothetical protein
MLNCLVRMAGNRQGSVRPIEAGRVFPALEALVPGPEDEVWYMNGHGRGTKVAWVEVDWRDDVALRALLGQWCLRFPAGTAARLVLDHHGIEAEDAVVALQKATADGGHQIDDAADIELSLDPQLKRRADVHLDLTTTTGLTGLERALLRLQRRLLFV